MMTREAAVQHRLFQSAMKGNVQAQIHLSRKFEEFEQRRAEIELGLRKLMEKMENPNACLTDEESTFVEAATRFLNGDLPADDEAFTPAGAHRPDSWDERMNPSKERMDEIVSKLRKKDGKPEAGKT